MPVVALVAVAEVLVETKLVSRMRCSVPRRLRTITRTREGGVAFAGGRSPSGRTTAPSAGVVCLKWVRALYLSIDTPTWNVTIRSPLSLDGRKMHRASLLATTESNEHPLPLNRVITHCARETELTVLQGFRTYPSFLHFLASVTFLAAYISVICIRGLVFAFSKPLAIVRYLALRRESAEQTIILDSLYQNEITPVHMLMLAFAGCAFTLVMGSFLGYHIYLVLCVCFCPFL